MIPKWCESSPSKLNLDLRITNFGRVEPELWPRDKSE